MDASIAVPRRAAAANDYLLGRGPAWFAYLMTVGLMVFDYVDRQIIGILEPKLAHDYKWSEIDYGNLVFWFQVAYALGYVVFGKLIDRLGARLGYALAVIIWT